MFASEQNENIVYERILSWYIIVKALKLPFVNNKVYQLIKQLSKIRYNTQSNLHIKQAGIGWDTFTYNSCLFNV